MAFIQTNNGSTDVFVHATVLGLAGIRGGAEDHTISYEDESAHRAGNEPVTNLQDA